MTAKRNDLAASLLFLIFSGALYYTAAKFPSKDSTSMVLNPGFYPQLLAGLLAFLSLLLFIGAVRKPVTDETPKKFFKSFSAFLLFGITLVLLILFPLLMETIGFGVTSFFFILIMVFVLSGSEKKQPFLLLGVSLGITVLIVLVFNVILEITFPKGLLF